MTHPNIFATDCLGTDDAATNARTDRAAWIVAKLDASGDYDARIWAKGNQVRVYVRTIAGKDCGWLGVLEDLSIDRKGLIKQAGTIASIASEVQS